MHSNLSATVLSDNESTLEKIAISESKLNVIHVSLIRLNPILISYKSYTS